MWQWMDKLHDLTTVFDLLCLQQFLRQNTHDHTVRSQEWQLHMEDHHHFLTSANTLQGSNYNEGQSLKL